MKKTTTYVIPSGSQYSIITSLLPDDSVEIHITEDGDPPVTIELSDDQYAALVAEE